MSTSRKLSLAAVLCLSIVMIAMALIRLIGTIFDMRSDSEGTAPVWATYWMMVEGCVSLTMTSVIIIRASFITKAIQENRRTHDSPWSRAGRRLLSTIGFSGSISGSKPSSPRHSDDRKGADPNPTNASTQVLEPNTLISMNDFITGGDERHEGIDDAAGDGDMDHRIHDLEHSIIRKDFGGEPSGKGTSH